MQKYRTDNLIFYISIFTPLVLVVGFFAYFFINNYYSLTPDNNKLLLAFKFFWIGSLFFVPLNFLGLLIYGSPRKQDDENVAKLEEFGWNQDKKLNIVYVSRGDNYEALRRAVNQTFNLLESYHINYEIDIVTDVAVEDKIIKTNKMNFHLIPESYNTPLNAKYKARALQYALEERNKMRLDYGNTWILHLDEESVLTKEALAGIHKFIAEPKNHESIGQGEIKYNAYEYGKRLFITAMDSMRTGDDLGRFRLQYKFFHKPFFGMHGSFILVPAKIEQAIGFDFGGRGSITEDAYFAIVAFSRGYRFDWVEGFIREQSPFSLKELLRQRRRWFNGLFFLAWDRKIPFKFRSVLFINKIFWSISWLGPVLAISNILSSLSHISFTPIFIGTLISAGIGPIYLVGAYRNLLGSNISKFRKITIYLISYLFLPLISLIEALAIVYATLKPVKFFEVVKK